MKAVSHLLAPVVIAFATTTASAQFVKGNEAVKVMPGGMRKVETPPLPSATLAAPCLADNPACTASGWRMTASARVTFDRQFNAPLQRLQSMLVELVGQRAQRWETWLTHAAAALTSAAVTWAVTVRPWAC